MLKMQALGITVSINSLLKNLSINIIRSEGANIMSQMIIDERWEGIAFLALYSESGEVVLHSNPNLIGKRFEEITKIFDKENPYYHKLMLKTGEEVFVSDTKISISDKPYILRVALHIYPAESLLRITKTHLVFIIAAAMLILITGAAAMFVIGKIEKMQLKMKELENLSILAKILAHEIRNPLGSIKGFSQYLIKKISEPSLRDYIDIIIKEALRLERLSDELSHFSSPYSINLSRINLRELFEETVLPFKSLSDIKIYLEVQDISITSDRDKLKQILTNLIQNSVDALAEATDKKIFITVKKIDGKIKIEITDTGIGMDEDTIIRAKEPFFTTKTKGTGLGLAIVIRLCEILKVEFNMKSRKDKGTTVWLIIPESL